MRLCSRLLLAPALLCAATLAAHADDINFSIIGPNGNFSFSLPEYENATSSNGLTSSNFSVATADYGTRVLLNDNLYVNSATDTLTLTSLDGNASYSAVFAPSLFSGGITHPTFTPGQYTALFAQAFVNSPSSSIGSDQLTVSVTPSASPVPEPPTLAFFGAGILGLAGITRSRVWQT